LIAAVPKIFQSAGCLKFSLSFDPYISSLNSLTDSLMLQSISTSLPIADLQAANLQAAPTVPLTAPATDGLALSAHALADPARAEIEAFIQQGYQKAYGAQISISMPWLLAIKNGRLKAALGMRSAREALFVEQYLTGSIESQPALVAERAVRAQIIEIGSLYSNAQKFTAPLFMVTAASLFYLGYRQVVFAATERVARILSTAGVELTVLGAADPARLAASTDQWGSYYTTDPQVLMVSLAGVMTMIDRTPAYGLMFEQFSAQIAGVCQTMETLR
jgi:hypothetical protein